MATSTQPLLSISDAAYAKVLGFRSAAPDPAGQAMWIEIAGSADGEYQYAIALKPERQARPGDAVQRHEDLAIVVPQADAGKLRGATVDWSGDEGSGGLMVDNPNKPLPKLPMLGDGLPMAGDPGVGAGGAAGSAGGPAPGPKAGGQGDLSGPLAQQVLQVLTAQINPAIAAHGGRAELVAVEEGTAYVRLGGGCQGCGMAPVTLGQGIEVAIRDAVPEIAQVVDVTDHASGTNPYFESAKK